MIDLNADLGEGLDDAPLLPFLTSANVACGAHAGDETIMARTVARLQGRGICIGAHPGYADREHFGRVDLELSFDAAKRLVREQIELLAEIVQRAGGRLSHVKAHGALYNRAAKDPRLARAIAEAVREHDRSLALFGLAGSLQLGAARAAGLRAVGEAFADRRYQKDGALEPRSLPGAVLHDPAQAAAQAVSIARDGFALASGGVRVQIDAQTLCLHGDTFGAAELAHAVRTALAAAGVPVAPPALASP